MKYLILLIILFPLLGLVLLLMLDFKQCIIEGKFIYVVGVIKQKNIGLFIIFIELFLVIVLYFRLRCMDDFLLSGNMLCYTYDIVSLNNMLISNLNFKFSLGIDYISYYFMLLTGILYPLILLINWSNLRINTVKGYMKLMLLLEGVIMVSFLVQDLLSFYILFESMLPILFVVIGIWGSVNRISASFYLFLYTLFGSYFMFLGFLILYIKTGSINFSFLVSGYLEFEYQQLVWLCIFLAILVKTPIWPFHLWLPKAHSEAPLGGSVLLAGVILKLSIYLVVRIMLPVLPEATEYFVPVVYVISIISILYSSISIMRQIDMKVIVAYSSIAHMGVIILGLFSNTYVGIMGSLLLSLAHGFISPGLFILLGGVLYDRYHTRVVMFYRGLSGVMPLFSIIFFIFTLANMGTPLTGNFVGEFSCIYGVIERSLILGFFASLSIILSAGYSIFLYNRITGGIIYLKGVYYQDLNRREYMVLFVLLVFVIILGVYPNVVVDDLMRVVQGLLYVK